MDDGKQVRITGILPGLAVCALVFANILVGWRTRAEKEQPYGRFTAQQIIDRTEPLCRVVAPEAERLQFIADRVRVDDPAGVLRLQWSLDCIDERGRQVAHFIWDASTCDLCVVGHEPIGASTPPRRREPFDRQEATQAAMQWLYALEMAPPGGELHLEGVPERRGINWCIECRTEDHSVAVVIDSHSGNLRLMTSRRRDH